VRVQHEPYVLDASIARHRPGVVEHAVEYLMSVVATAAIVRENAVDGSQQLTTEVALLFVLHNTQLL
jgi:hypothetical protein